MEIVLICLSVLILILLFVLVLRPNRSSNVNFKELEERMIRIEGELDKIVLKIEGEFRENRKEISQNLRGIQDSNEKKLDEMRETVDEKLKASVEKRFDESFKTISQQLTQVHTAIGEIKNVGSSVDNLRKVMDGVKTRGIYGEVQLGSIISDMMAPGQYAENIVTKKGTNERVEFAIRMPGNADSEVLLPIDSKFPIENYSRLIAAYDSGTKTDIEKYRKALADDVKTQAKKISSKYIDVPATTDVAVMFLPTESLFAEIARIPGLTDEIRNKLHVVITCPSTLPAILSGLQQGFRSHAMGEQASKVWEILGATKTQFSRFGDLLEGVQKKLQQSAEQIDRARTTSRQIEKKLKDVETLPESSSQKLIGKIDF